MVGIGVASSAVKMIAAEKAEASETKLMNESGKRYGMVIDTRKCIKDCNDCMDACHSIHNVPDFKLKDGTPDPKNQVKWIWKEAYHNTFPSKSNQFLAKDLSNRKFLLLCNHCKEPPCVRVCPTKATFRRTDGIVLMDFHRCVGCRFCMAACPYGSRSFNWLNSRQEDGMAMIGGREMHAEFPTRERGVVEKCNFCAERLAKGLKPACVEKCLQNCITFGDLNDPESEVRKILSVNKTIQRKFELGTGPSVFYIV